MSLQLHHRVNAFYLNHSEIISDDRLEGWPDLFAEDCFYRLTSRTNFDRRLPLGTILCESRGALIDRVTAIRNTMVYAPRTIIHAFSNLRVVNESDNGEVVTRSAFCIWQTLADGETQLQMVGRSFDRLREENGELKFRERIAVFDSELVPGAVVYPV